MSKNFFKDGHWIEKTSAPRVHVCSCGTKYIKTRERQRTCVRCIHERVAR